MTRELAAGTPPIILGRVRGTGDAGVLISVFTLQEGEDRIVADRLKKFNGLDADGVLYPPLPHDAPFRPGPFGDYFFYPSRINEIKRQLAFAQTYGERGPDLLSRIYVKYLSIR